MALQADMKKLKGMVDANKERRSGMRYLKKNSTTNLRVLLYTDADGVVSVAHQLSEHRMAGSDSKGLGHCRLEMFKQPCAMCKMNKTARETGEKAPFTTRTRYAINAIDVDNDPKSVKRWVIPATVFDQLAGFLIDPQWADMLDPKVGVCVAVTSAGSGLDTEYSTKPHRKPYPVDAALLKLVVDPATEIKDSGLDAQCEAIGITAGEIFEESELEQYDAEALKPVKDVKKTAPATAKPKPAAKPAPEPEPEPESTGDLEEGDKVNFGGDTETVYTLKSIDGDNVEIEDADGNVFTGTLADLTKAESEPDSNDDGDEANAALEPDEDPVGEAVGKGATIEIKGKKYHGVVEEHAPNGAIKLRLDNKSLLNCNIKSLVFDEEAESGVEQEQQPKCFGDSTMYNPEDEDCMSCTFQEECVGNADLHKAGLGKGKPVAKSGKSAPVGTDGRKAAGANPPAGAKPVGKTAPAAGKSAKDLVAGILGKSKK